MPETAANDIRELRAWIHHWIDDAACGLAPTITSLGEALIVADRLVEVTVQMTEER